MNRILRKTTEENKQTPDNQRKRGQKQEAKSEKHAAESSKPAAAAKIDADKMKSTADKHSDGVVHADQEHALRARKGRPRNGTNASHSAVSGASATTEA